MFAIRLLEARKSPGTRASCLWRCLAGTALLGVAVVGHAASAPQITSPTSASGTAGVSFLYSIAATGSPTSFNATGLPPGLTVSTSTGAISGTPDLQTSVGTWSVTLSASNASGTGTAGLQLKIAEPLPVITSLKTASGVVGTSFLYLTKATNQPTGYTIPGGGLPGGLILDISTGRISGIPTAAGTFTIDLTAINSGGSGSIFLAITITNPPKPAITSALTANGSTRLPFSYTIAATNNPTSFGFSGGSLPAGLSLNTTTGVISGTPSVTGSSSVTISATNSGGTGTAVLDFTISAGPTPTPTPTPGPSPTPTPTPTFPSGSSPTPTPTPTALGSQLPVFTTQPMSVTVSGGTVALYTQATQSPTYQWYLNGVPLQSVTDPILYLADGYPAAGVYTCTASNYGGMTQSNPATLTVTPAPLPSRLVNLSCRADVGTGANILFAGFVVGGEGTSGPLPVLVRGTGPALSVAPFLIPGTLPDPFLTIDNVSSGTVVGTNSGWGGDAAVAAASAAVGAFPLANPASHDTALLESLTSGVYTSEIAGQSGDTGIALAEIYDATPSGASTAATPRLINLSARVQVGIGLNAPEIGFVIAGPTAKTVLIRASGPALAAAPFNLTGALSNPQLTLNAITPSGSTLLTSNAGWGGDPMIALAATVAGAFPWSPSSTDSALVITLPPGIYSAEVSGVNGDFGIALVEVYEIP